MDYIHYITFVTSHDCVLPISYLGIIERCLYLVLIHISHANYTIRENILDLVCIIF